MSSDDRRVRFLVAGRVQGVGFRAHTLAEAQRLGLVGFVRNRRDAAVDGEAQGPKAQVALFVDWLHTGSPWSRVERVEIEELATNASDAEFVVRR